MIKWLLALLGVFALATAAAAQQPELPPNALAIENGLPWIVGRAAVPDAARDLFNLPAIRWDRREQELADGTTVVEEIIARDGAFATARVTRSDNSSSVVYYNVWGPLVLNTFFRGPSRVRGAMTTGLVTDGPADTTAPFARQWRFTLATFAVSEGIPADIRTRRRSIAGTARRTGNGTVEVEVNGRMLRLPSYRIETILRDAGSGDEIRTYREAYIPALAALTVTEALGNSRDITNLDAAPVERVRFQVAPAVLEDVLAQAL